MKTKGFYWHVHHNILLKWCYDYDKRVNAIKTTKPANEIEIRLRLLKPVKGGLPKEVVEAWQKYVEVGQKRDKVWQKYSEAWQKRVEAGQKYDEATQKYVEARQKLDEVGQKRDKVWQKYGEAIRKHKVEIKTLHAKECGCKEWTGKRLCFQDEVNNERK